MNSYLIVRARTLNYMSQNQISFERLRDTAEILRHICHYIVCLLQQRTSAGRLPVVFERLEGEVNSVVTEMAIGGTVGRVFFMTAFARRGLGVRASVSDADIGSLVLARELGDRTDISLEFRLRDLFPSHNGFHVGK